MNTIASNTEAPRSGGCSWHVVQLKPKADRIAEQNLRRQGFGVFAPLLVRTSRRRGDVRKDRRPLFPGYLFVSVSSEHGRWRSIAGTLGVQRLLTFGADKPAEVSEEFMVLLQQRCDESGAVSLPALKHGDAVRIVGGPFADYVANVDSIPSERRIWVLLDLLGRETRVALDRHQVEQRD